MLGGGGANETQVVSLIHQGGKAKQRVGAERGAAKYRSGKFSQNIGPIQRNSRAVKQPREKTATAKFGGGGGVPVISFSQ